VIQEVTAKNTSLQMDLSGDSTCTNGTFRRLHMYQWTFPAAPRVQMDLSSGSTCTNGLFRRLYMLACQRYESNECIIYTCLPVVFSCDWLL